MSLNRKSMSSGLKTLVQTLLFLLVIVSLVGCGAAAQPMQPTSTAAAVLATQLAPTDTPQPTATATATALPTATATAVPPTATPIPALALADKGFNVWCLPTAYAGTKPTSADAPDYANQLTTKNAKLEIRIPATFCEIVVTLNQAAPKGLKVVFYDGKTPFQTKDLVASEGKINQVWASVDHSYVVNPPYWEITYTVAVVDAAGKELYSSPVKFAKATPKACPYGGLPDPVTLWCTVTDPWEIEPYPWSVYPYDHANLPTMVP